MARPSGFDATFPAAGRHLSNAATTSFHGLAVFSYGRNHTPPRSETARARLSAPSASAPLNVQPNAERYAPASVGSPRSIARLASTNKRLDISSASSRPMLEASARTMLPDSHTGESQS